MTDRHLTASGGMLMEDWDAGDWGGLFAGFVAGAAALSKGLAWLLNWNEARSSGRAAKLVSWERSLVAREKEYREEIEGQLRFTRTELARVEGDVEQLRAVLFDVTTELHRHASGSPALSRAVRLLGMAYPIDPATPADLTALAAQVDAMSAGRIAAPDDN